MSKLYIYCKGDDFTKQDVRLCRGEENFLLDLGKETNEITAFVVKAIPKLKIVGGHEIKIALSKINEEFRGMFDIAMILGFIMFHATHNDKDDNNLVLEIKNG